MSEAPGRGNLPLTGMSTSPISQAQTASAQHVPDEAYELLKGRVQVDHLHAALEKLIGFIGQMFADAVCA